MRGYDLHCHEKPQCAGRSLSCSLTLCVPHAGVLAQAPAPAPSIAQHPAASGAFILSAASAVFQNSSTLVRFGTYDSSMSDCCQQHGILPWDIISMP